MKEETMSETARTTITPTDNGPLRVTGPLTVIDADGKAIQVADELLLCRCGGSSNKPFCDGTHRGNGFESEVRDG